MPPLYTGSADEWSYLGSYAASSSISFEFIIDHFEERMKKKPKELNSHKFSVKDSLWHVQVRPESDDEKTKGYVGVFLYNDNEHPLKVSCKIKIGSKVRQFENTEVRFENGFGWNRFFSHQKCQEQLKNGKLEVKLEMEVLWEEEDTLISGKGKNFGHILDTNFYLKLFEDKIFTDYNVVCSSGKSFPCHRVFLAARSPVFKAMIETEMKEAKEATVKLVNFNETVVENLIKYFYTGNVDEEVLKENAVSFLDLGERYDMAELKVMVEQVMIANLDKENMVNFFLAGDLYKGVKIRAAAKAFLRLNMKSLLDQEGWKEALKERDLVFELLESFM
eukprot:GFUD01000625.1.p1 GENE.GFUD01000625.1~~GFUD01000625.1.p1  ORF type:complete len:334 (+),score=81.24 GFUD01000625.1:45-1046(+)